jgi:hypothetical protein
MARVWAVTSDRCGWFSAGGGLTPDCCVGWLV